MTNFSFIYFFLFPFFPFSFNYFIMNNIFRRRSIRKFHNFDVIWPFVRIFTNVSFVEDCFDSNEIMVFSVLLILERPGSPIHAKAVAYETSPYSLRSFSSDCVAHLFKDRRTFSVSRFSFFLVFWLKDNRVLQKNFQKHIC